MSGKSRKESFKKGDRVSARWSGSSVFYDAKVLEVTSRNYRVQYDDGSVSSLKLTDVKKLEPSKTPPKTTKQSKSRSRSRSAGRKPRSRSRSRSPARREKKKVVEKKTTTKEEKKSPKEETKKVEGSPSNSNSVSPQVSRDSVDGIVAKTILTRERIGATKTETKTVTTFNSFSKDSSREGSSSSSLAERPRSARLAALRTAQAAKVSNAISAEKAKYSDDEEEEESEEETVPSTTLSKGWQSLYFVATLLKMLLVPASLLFLVFACTKKQCTVLDVPQFYTRWRDFFHSVKYPMAGVFGFHLLQAALSLVPVGKKVEGQVDKNVHYRLNGIYALLLQVVAFGVCCYFGVYTNLGYDKFRPIALSAAIYGIVCAIALHIHSVMKGGATAQSKVPYLGNFYNGSFTNPVLFGKLDLKTSFIRAGLIGSVLLNLSIVSKYFFMKGYVTVPLAMTSGMQVFFVLDLLVREEKWLTTATYTSDTLGYAFLTTMVFLVPISLSLQTVYLFIFESRSTALPHWCSGAIAGLFFVGYYIYLTSTNLKHNFRTNPFSPSLSGVVSVPTSRQKRRLIASGLWGRVRHPNYLGLFIMATAWTLPCGFTHLVPFGPLALLAIALIVRSFRIEAECLDKYGPAWKNYAGKVRSRLIPYIF